MDFSPDQRSIAYDQRQHSGYWHYMQASLMSEMSRLKWLCRRGMKELDVVLSRFLEHHYEAAEPLEQAQFRELLQLPDPELYNLLLGRDVATNPDCARLLKRLRRSSGQS